jgi:hypothetical protein
MALNPFCFNNSLFFFFFFFFAAEKIRVQEDLLRLRSMRREGETRREHLLNSAKLLQARANTHKAKVSKKQT